MASIDPRSWTIASVARSIVSRVTAQPVALILALAVAPTVWYLPAEVLYDSVVPPSGSGGSARSVAVHTLVMVATTLWWGMVYAGQLQIAIDVARGGRVTWSRFVQGVRHSGRIAATALPCMLPLQALVVLPDAAWLDPLVLFLIPAAIGSAILLAARTVLWAPLVLDRGLSLGAALSIAWSSSNGQVWRLVRLGLALGLPLLPIFVLEMMLLGKSWVATGLVGATYALATAHLYPSMTASDVRTANSSESEPSRLDGRNQHDSDLPQRGSGWSKPFE